MRNYDLFDNVLAKLEDGMEITFTANNVALGDDFLIFGRHHNKCTCTFRNEGVWYVYFEGEEPMELINCPDSFYMSILKNIQ